MNQPRKSLITIRELGMAPQTKIRFKTRADYVPPQAQSKHEQFIRDVANQMGVALWRYEKVTWLGIISFQTVSEPDKKSFTIKVSCDVELYNAIKKKDFLQSILVLKQSMSVLHKIRDQQFMLKVTSFRRPVMKLLH